MPFLFRVLTALLPLLKEAYFKNRAKDAKTKQVGLWVLLGITAFLAISDDQSFTDWLRTARDILLERPIEETVDDIVDCSEFCPERQWIVFLEDRTIGLIRENGQLHAQVADLTIALELRDETIVGLRQEIDELRRPSETPEIPQAPDEVEFDWYLRYRELYND